MLYCIVLYYSQLHCITVTLYFIMLHWYCSVCAMCHTVLYMYIPDCIVLDCIVSHFNGSTCIVSYCFVSLYMYLHHTVLCHIVNIYTEYSLYVKKVHFIIFVALYCTTLYCTTLFCVTLSDCVTLYYFIMCHTAALHCVVSHGILSHCILSHCIVSHRISLKMY